MVFNYNITGPVVSQTWGHSKPSRFYGEQKINVAPQTIGPIATKHPLSIEVCPMKPDVLVFQLLWTQFSSWFVIPC